MNKLLYIMSIGMLGLLFSCEKDESKATMLENPIVPTFQTIPDLTLTRAAGTNTLKFVGTLLNPGYNASAKYFLEACPKGNNFVNTAAILSDVQDTSMLITVSDLNSILLKKFPGDQVSEADLRIRAVMVVDGGTGSKTFEYTSETKTVNVTLYGLPRLDFITGGVVVGKVESALGNGVYAGFVKFDNTKTYTLKDPDANKTYGGNSGILSENGSAISINDNGWNKVNADVNGLTYAVAQYRIGLVGSASPNGWDSPDSPMDYDAATGTWQITVDLIVGEIKFRKNDGWAWNLGGTASSLVHNGANIAVSAAGNYTITLTITNDVGELGSFTIVKN
ncbi:SusE domain-containing protein [Williamwhitmania taraxaci]|uniref:SusE outer membrane protein n=1 Tax=Williamwhitmania taraxaci TaxID=1640674 RepID=A0A1G6HTS5_9BACT|nr:SusE domain-containing protein [Williamwhitmania taraxaci]SDB97548.1 SusE outer membrane protein [Williamwhitmania taraxaci]